MPAGIIYKAPRKKKVFSNKSLTRQIRALKGTEGSFLVQEENLYNTVAFVAGTPQLKYCTFIPSPTANGLYKHARFFTRVTATGVGALRMIILRDNQFNGTAILPGDVLDSTDVNSSYKVVLGGVTWGLSSKHKNWAVQPRREILVDKMITFNSNQLNRSFMTDVKFHNARLTEDANVAVYFLTDVIATIECQYNVIWNNLYD